MGVVKINKFNISHSQVILWGIFLLFLSGRLSAQPIQFHHINSSQGLSSNTVTCNTVDQAGLLWIGTVEGLNVYDGYNMSLFVDSRSKQPYTQHISALFCDSRNRIWFGSSDGLSYLDSDREIVPVIINKGDNSYIQDIFETLNHDVIIFSNKGVAIVKITPLPKIPLFPGYPGQMLQYIEQRYCKHVTLYLPKMTSALSLASTPFFCSIFQHDAKCSKYP